MSETLTRGHRRRAPAECRGLVFEALDGGWTGSAKALGDRVGIASPTAGKYMVEWEARRGIASTTRVDTRGRVQPSRKRWTGGEAGHVPEDSSVSAWVVYFIRDESGPIKIGRSFGSAAGRLRDLQVGNPRPLTLLATSASLVEADVHQMFAADRITGEWFAATDSLLAFIRGFQ